MTGFFITLYGVNNTGKSTQAKLLQERLEKEGRACVYLKYPVYDLEPSGPYINKLLRATEQVISEEELQMWYTINRYQYQDELELFLEEGKIVIAEDYVGTGLAWGTAKGADLNWLETMNQHLLQEDLAILLNGTRYEEAQEKVHVHETDSGLMERCRQVHLELSKSKGWYKIDAAASIEAVHHSIWELVQQHLNK